MGLHGRPWVVGLLISSTSIEAMVASPSAPSPRSGEARKAQSCAYSIYTHYNNNADFALHKVLEVYFLMRDYMLGRQKQH